MRVPRDSRVQVNASAATVRIAGVAGAHVRSKSGAVTIDSIPGRVEAHAQLGGLTIRHLDGEVLANTTAGDVHATGVRGTLVITTNAGFVQVADTESPVVSISTGAGNIEMMGPLRAGGRYDLRTDRGNIDLRPGHSFDATVTAGSIRGEWRSARRPEQGAPPRPGGRSVMRFGNGAASLRITSLGGNINVH
jgi:DUF4097 and DUF4098 domain-containing protein YvlB